MAPVATNAAVAEATSPAAPVVNVSSRTTTLSTAATTGCDICSIGIDAASGMTFRQWGQDLSGSANPATLVSALDLTLTHGTMPAPMKSQLVSAVSADSGGALQKVEDAIYLILTSGYYNVWH